MGTIRKKKIFTLIISFCLLLTCSTASYAEWVIVTHEKYPPYNFLDEAGKPAGLDTEIVQAVMAYLKIGYTMKFVSWKRVISMTERNQVDLSFQFKSKEERRRKYLLVGPLRSGKTVFAVRKDSEIADYETLNDLRPYTIGHNLGYSYGKEFDNASYLKKDDGATTNSQLIKKLLANRIEVIIGDLYTLTYTAKREGVYDKIRFLKVYKQFDRYVAVPKKRAANAGFFDHGLNAIRENGVYEEIIKKWQ